MCHCSDGLHTSQSASHHITSHPDRWSVEHSYNNNWKLSYFYLKDETSLFSFSSYHFEHCAAVRVFIQLFMSIVLSTSFIVPNPELCLDVFCSSRSDTIYYHSGLGDYSNMQCVVDMDTANCFGLKIFFICFIVGYFECFWLSFSAVVSILTIPILRSFSSLTLRMNESCEKNVQLTFQPQKIKKFFCILGQLSVFPTMKQFFQVFFHSFKQILKYIRLLLHYSLYKNIHIVVPQNDDDDDGGI